MKEKLKLRYMKTKIIFGLINILKCFTELFPASLLYIYVFQFFPNIDFCIIYLSIILHFSQKIIIFNKNINLIMILNNKNKKKTRNTIVFLKIGSDKFVHSETYQFHGFLKFIR